ncbi:MAG TPA: SRPBCC domain-containing protein [Thermomicrobiales bacterium]|nr:SRPBCC domain-containing protein [Thermomicrobiales bacterium]
MPDLEPRIEDHVLALDRVIEATPEEAYAAFTEPAQLDQWWGPDGYTTVTHAHDFRRGGVWHYTLVADPGSGGMDASVKAYYQRIEAPGLLAYRDTFVDETGTRFDGSPEIDVEIRFRAVADGTHVLMTSTFASSDLLQQIVERGMVQGLSQAFRNLDRLLARRRATN